LFVFPPLKDGEGESRERSEGKIAERVSDEGRESKETSVSDGG